MKYAFITGSGRGLGAGFVEYLIANGYFVFAGVRKIKPEFRNNENLKYVICDVTNDISIEDCVNEIQKYTTSLDLLINNAGVNKDSITNGNKNTVCKLEDLKRRYLLKMFDSNSIAPMIVLQKFAKLLKNNPSFVVNISSDRASYHDEFENSTANYGYRASKIALNMFTFVSINDLPKNIKIFTVHPGDVKTDMNSEGEQTPLEQAEKIINITKNWNEEFNGKFMRWSGEEYPL